MAPLDMTTEGRSAGQIVAWSRTLFAPSLREAVESLPASMRLVAGYHLGWWDADGKPADASGGKAIRPALALLSAEAVGGAPEDAVPAAVAVELVHNFSLLHDDVMDGDETRRHRLTAWRVFGVGIAILAGDALLTLALDVLAAAGKPGETVATRTLCATVQDLIDGQFADVAFESRIDIGLGECVEMAEHKTGALISCACALGALAGGGSAEQVEHLSQFGRHLGLAFQVADDLQGIWGDPQMTGKPAHSDLRNRKKSLPVVAALVSGTPAGEELVAWYGSPMGPTTADLTPIAALVEAAGGRQWAEAQLAVLQAEAIGHLRSAGPVARAAAELGSLAQVVTGSYPTSRPDRHRGDGSSRPGAGVA